MPLIKRPLSRNALIVASVLLFHGAALWALQTGLIQRVVEVLVPKKMVEMVVLLPLVPLALVVVLPVVSEQI